MARKLSYSQEASKVPSIVTACGYDGCPDAAMTREFDNLPLCRRHWEGRCDARDKKYFKDRNLVTRDEKRGHVDGMIRNLARKLSGSANKDWARNIVQRFDDGENMPQRSVELARKALGIGA